MVVEVIGGIEPARELILAALEARKPVVTANKELLANIGDGAVRGCRRIGCRSPLRSGRRRWHPTHPSAAREPARRADSARDGHRQRHDQLHPHPDDRGPGVVRRRARRGPEPRFRRARSHRGCRGLRRRRQGRDPRVHRVRCHAWSPATSTTRASAPSPPPTSPWPPGSAMSSSCWRSPSASTTARSQYASTRRWCRSPIRWPACETATTPFSSKATRSARSCSTGAEPVACRRRARCSATSSTPLATCARARTARSGTFARTTIRPIDETTAEYLGVTRGRSIVRACSTPSPVCSPATTSASARRSRRGSATMPAWCSSPTRHVRPTCRRRSATCATSMW